MSRATQTTFDDILAKIRSESKNTHELGSRFERIAQDFFRTDTIYAGRFEKVWLWKQWPENDGADTGIDLVAKQYDGELCAIQCKCYSDDGSLDQKSVSTFLAKAKSLDIPHTILVYTGETLTRNAAKILRDSRTGIITPEHFRQSSIDWSDFPKLARIKKPHKLRPHQAKALDDVLEKFSKHDRGQLIMACGTGKTLTALHIAERQVGSGGMVLYLVPSISLILQAMREWSENANIRHNYMAVCSDKSTGEDGTITELESPVSTNPETLKPYIKARQDSMTVIFSTYHSIEVVERAVDTQKFDLVLCDEAHRTTGAEGKSFYTRVHNEKFPAKRRLFMTATPRVYSDAIVKNGEQTNKVVYSMNDPKRYGPIFHELKFTKAVQQGILADFKVKIAVIDSDKVDADFQQSIADSDNAMPLNERTLLAAVWHGLNYPDDDESKPHLLQRVIAFCNRIDRSQMFAGDIKDPEDNDRSFAGVVDEINQKRKTGNTVEVRHIDGKDNAMDRRKEMRWLAKSNVEPSTCRILSNARCLSEGVDVPALDGVVFLNPRKSVVDVVQSVGRVMRKVKGKDFGYVILPVAIPAGISHDEAMNDNKTFKVVWEVLNALRSHDEDFAREINKLILDKGKGNTGPITTRISVSILGEEESSPETISKYFDDVKSKIIEKVGDINYYDKYGQKLGDATHTIEARIKAKMKRDQTVRNEIAKFHRGLQTLINNSVTEESTVQAISQHMVLARVFDELFSGEFTSHNPISVAFEEVISKIGLGEELLELRDFYEDVSREVAHVKNDTRKARQEFIKKIYGNFFESADKKGSEKHGVVYTPVEVIDFIINSVQHVLKTEFGMKFDDRNVKILEPFTGTGTFLVRLLESGYITSNMYEKYKHDMFANELILLAYYIATVNIETTYQSLRRGKYVPFDGISYTDTLDINARHREGEQHRQKTVPLDGALKIPHQRIRQQRASHLHVIMGNPPYSKGQSNYNDNNPNMKYPDLDKRIKDTYMAKATTHDKKSLYDSYVRSIRWATDRIGNSGIIAFVTNASFIHTETAAGIRASLHEEFTDVWCFDLRGNGRITGDGRNIFEYSGQSTGGTRTPVAIVILVKNPKKTKKIIHYSRLQDEYYSGHDKRERVKQLKLITGIDDWKTITPDKHHDWVGQRNEEFYNYTAIGSKEAKAGNGHALFKIFSLGIATHRDDWVYNSSKNELAKNMKKHIDYCTNQDLNNIKFDPRKAKWTDEMITKLKKIKTMPNFDMKQIRFALYRPFFKQHMYFDKIFNSATYRIPQFFPKGDSENLAICIPDKGKAGMFSTMVTDTTPDLHLIEQSQYFPFRVYSDAAGLDGGGVDDTSRTSSSLSPTSSQDSSPRSSLTQLPTSKWSTTDNAFPSATTRRVAFGENILDSALEEYQEHYGDKKITKLDIFFYVYGLLHHEGYKKKFANALSKDLPRIPMAPDFAKISKAGRDLTKLHLNYETGPRHKLKKKAKFGDLEKIAFSRAKKGGKLMQDKTKLKVNGIEAFEIPEIRYRVNGRTPIEWAADRYRLTQHKESGIINDPCQGMTEQKTTEFIERLVHVGVESDRIIAEISRLPFEPTNWKPKKAGMDVFVGQTPSSPAQTKFA